MLGIHHYWLFITTAIVLVLTPGPHLIFIHHLIPNPAPAPTSVFLRMASLRGAVLATRASRGRRAGETLTLVPWAVPWEGELPRKIKELEAELREVEENWDAATAPPGVPSVPVQSLVPFREQVHHALTLLTVPAAPRLIATVHEAFFGADLPSQRFTSLRRDEEKYTFDPR